VTTVVSRLVAANNRRIRRVDADAPNPRPIDGEAWYADLRAARTRIRAEWDAFEAADGRLPLIEDLFGTDQGNVGSWWRLGPMISRRRPLPPLADLFPDTVEALLRVPGLLSAVWSVFGPGTELPPHTGENAGSLNFLLGVRCPAGAGHEIEGVAVDLAEGDLVVFDDNLEHAAWNRSDEPRVLVIGDLLRPLPRSADRANRGVQFALHHLTPRYQRSAAVTAELHRALNG
jgi:beta-hydroxylase